jgi:hypothetical protein
MILSVIEGSSGLSRLVELPARVQSVISIIPAMLDFLDDGVLNASPLLRLIG